MAFHAAVAGERPTAAQWNDWVFRRVMSDCTSSTRPSSPVEGQHIFETDTDKALIHDGTNWIELGKVGAWTTYTPTWATSGTAPAIGNGTIAGRYQRLFGRTFAVQITFTAGSTTTFGTGLWSFTTPSSIVGAANYFTGSGFAVLASIWPIIPQVGPSSAIFPLVSASATDPRLATVTATVPASWASTNYMTMTTIIESTS